MIKISTLFKKDPSDLGRVINEVNPENEWVLTNSKATRKFDGTASAIINGEIYKRYDVKKGKNIPKDAIGIGRGRQENKEGYAIRFPFHPSQK